MEGDKEYLRNLVDYRIVTECNKKSNAVGKKSKKTKKKKNKKKNKKKGRFNQQKNVE